MKNPQVSADICSGPAALAVKRRIAVVASIVFAAVAIWAVSRIGSAGTPERAYILENGSVVEAAAVQHYNHPQS